MHQSESESISRRRTSRSFRKTPSQGTSSAIRPRILVVNGSGPSIACRSAMNAMTASTSDLRSRVNAVRRYDERRMDTSVEPVDAGLAVRKGGRQNDPQEGADGACG